MVYSHNPINLRGEEMVTLQIPNLTYTNANLSNFGDVQNNSIVCTLPINVPPFALMRYESTDDTFNLGYRILKLIACVLYVRIKT